ncbi:MAG: phosphate transport system permease protein [Planctomycetota bacterium]|jgi:phosphate transport system permease protein
MDSDQTPKPRRTRTASLSAHGEPMVWLCGGALSLCLVMIVGLLGLVIYQGSSTFWPQEIVRLETQSGQAFLGPVTRTEDVPGTDGEARSLVRTGNFEQTGTNFDWVPASQVVTRKNPEWALVLERLASGRSYGVPMEYRVGGELLASGPEAVWGAYQTDLEDVNERSAQARAIEVGPLAANARRLRQAQLDIRRAELASGEDSSEVQQARSAYEAASTLASQEGAALAGELSDLHAINSAYVMRIEIADGSLVDVPVADIVRAVPVNRLSFGESLSVYVDRWQEFLFDNPRKANSAGGVWPALFGTVIMTLIMSVLVVPFGVLAALYLREYAKQGVLVSLVRIAVNNLAGVPSIVFGVFGLSFFCYIVGGTIDEIFFAEYLPSPKFGKGGVLWASLTLALLTLPVVIVATEEALAAVPSSMRAGSYACGATRWQTIRRIVLPRAMPGIMTGMILAVARGAGEVAPLMLVGAVKLAPDLPVDFSTFPYIFPERSFMHLGFHIYDVAFQSQDSEAAKPMVYTTTLLLIALVIGLNLAAVAVRSRLRRRFAAAR